MPKGPTWTVSSEPITTGPHGRRKPTAAKAAPATDSHLTKSSRRTCRSALRPPGALGVNAASTPATSAVWPAHSRAGAEGPDGTATGAGGRYAPGPAKASAGWVAATAAATTGAARHGPSHYQG